MMVARSLGSIAADALTVQERVLLFCVGSGTDGQTAGITGATVTMLAVATRNPVHRAGVSAMAPIAGMVLPCGM
jgi:hypothetical protein